MSTEIAGPLPVFCAQLRPLVMKGTKRMTRRVVVPQPVNSDMFQFAPWKPGEIRYLREPLTRCTWHKDGAFADYADDRANVRRRDNPERYVRWRWQKSVLPSIFMPAEYARTFVRIESVRVERLQDITEEDARQEGCDYAPALTPIGSFMKLWDRLNAARGYPWSSNCWVWVLSWKLIDKPSDPTNKKPEE